MTHDTFLLRVKQTDPPMLYIPGDYCYIKNLRGLNPNEERPFSLASSPANLSYIEFCIKIYGEWTLQVSQLKPGMELLLSAPQRDATLTKKDYIVFLVGGAGIAPVMSMLRYMESAGDSRDVTIIYGNKREEDIIYRSVLERLASNNNHLQVIHMLSEEPSEHNWKGERGNISEEVIRKYISLSQKPLFYIFGNLFFITLAHTCLQRLHVSEEDIIVRK